MAISAECTLTKVCDGQAATYRGIACDAGRYSECVIDLCESGLVCQEFMVIAAVCVSCAVIDGQTCYIALINAIGTPIAEGCYQCGCDNFDINSSCILQQVSYCIEQSDAPKDEGSRCGVDSIFGEYTLAEGTLVLT